MNEAKEFKYIYGPVSSWRLGRSLGIDPLSRPEKICNFSCAYCQLGPTGAYTGGRAVFVSAAQILNELDALPQVGIDYLTLSSRGEPTLAANLGEIAAAIKAHRSEPLAVITNASLMDREEVRADLLKFDFVIAKLDGSGEESFSEINRPAPGLVLGNIIRGLKLFAERYNGKLALQTMLTTSNVHQINGLADIYRFIGPDEIQVNTPLRPSPVKPLSREELTVAASRLRSLNILSRFGKAAAIRTVYEADKEKVEAISSAETLKRRGKI